MKTVAHRLVLLLGCGLAVVSLRAAPTEGSFRYPRDESGLAAVQAAILGKTRLIESDPADILLIPDDRRPAILQTLASATAENLFRTGSYSVQDDGVKSALESGAVLNPVRYGQLGYFLSRMPEEFEVATGQDPVPAWLVGARVTAGAYLNPQVENRGIESLCQRLMDYVRQDRNEKGLLYLAEWADEFSADRLLQARLTGRLARMKMKITQTLRRVRGDMLDGDAAMRTRSGFPIKVTGAVQESDGLSVFLSSEEYPDGFLVRSAEPKAGVRVLTRTLPENRTIPLLFLQTQWRLPVGGNQQVLGKKSVDLSRHALALGGRLFLSGDLKEISFEQLERAAAHALDEVRTLEGLAGTQDGYESLFEYLLSRDDGPLLDNIVTVDEVAALRALDASLKLLMQPPQTN